MKMMLLGGKYNNVLTWKFLFFVGLIMNTLWVQSQNSFKDSLFGVWEIYHREVGDATFEKIELLFSADKTFFFEEIGTYINWKIPIESYNFETDDYEWTFTSCNPLLILNSIECDLETCSAYLYEPSESTFLKTKVKYENGIIYQYYNDSKEVQYMLKKISK